MKTSNRIIFLLICIISLNACKKSFLEVQNTRELYRQTYVKDLNTMENFVNGIYVLQSTYYEHGVGNAYPELVADNIKPLESGLQSLLAAYSWNQIASDMTEVVATESSQNMNGPWTISYQIIRACSFVIEDIDKYNAENPSKANDIKGQAYAIRAMVHFKMVNMFAQPFKFTENGSHIGVPYITTSDISKPYSRQTVSQVYDNIISDFNSAIELLHPTVSDTRIMNIAAAKGLLARVYLFKEDYAKARTLATEICNQFPLLTIANGYPDNLFKDKKPNESEILYHHMPVWLAQSGISNSTFLGRFFRGAGRRYTATDDLALILRENTDDIRSNWITDVSGDWNIVKYPRNAAPEVRPAITIIDASFYHPVVRSSEMFLTVAEASAKTGDENTARQYLDAIRVRANPSILPVTATGTALLDSIYKERRKELAFEGFRMYDLQRWKLGVHRTDGLFPNSLDLPFPHEKAIAPIPTSDVSISGIPQNAGY